MKINQSKPSKTRELKKKKKKYKKKQEDIFEYGNKNIMSIKNQNLLCNIEALYLEKQGNQNLSSLNI